MAFDTDANRPAILAAPTGAPREPAGASAFGRRHRAAAIASVRAAQTAAAGARLRQDVAIPGYLLRVYWWTYVHPLAVAVFDHMLVINLILLTNYNKMRDRALACFADAPDRVLQVSCAYGDLTPRLAGLIAPGGRLDVIDVLAIQLSNVARKLAADLPVRLLNMDATALALPSNHYDRVLLFFLLHEQPPEVRARTLAEALRVAKPGGALVIADFAQPYRWNPFRYLWAIFLSIFEPFALDLWREELATMLPKDCGATIEVTRYFGGLFQRAVVTKPTA